VQNIYNYKLITEFDGTDFHGWQVQPEKITIQGTINQVLSKIFQKSITVIGCSRTDAGVHALQHVSNFNIDFQIDIKKIHRSLNAMLPKSIAVQTMLPVQQDFHARKDAKGKNYYYQIYNHHIRRPLLNRFCWHLHYKLDWETIIKATQILIGRHDFNAFKAANCNSKTSTRTINSINSVQSVKHII